jgi:hypothetical protein
MQLSNFNCVPHKYKSIDVPLGLKNFLRNKEEKGGKKGGKK